MCKSITIRFPIRVVKDRRRIGTLVVLMSAVLLLMSVAGSVSAADLPGIAIVTGQSGRIEGASKAEFSRLFLGLSSELGGDKLKPVNLTQKDIKDQFLQKLTGMTPAKIEDHFVQMELRGEGKRPPEVATVDDLVKLIASTSKVVSWIPIADLEKLPAAQRSALKVLTVDGHKPGEDGYAFAQ